MPEQRLWAPWRLDYIKGPKPDECIFCTKPDEGDDEQDNLSATIRELPTTLRTGQRALAALREIYRPEGFNIGINQGKVAGAGVEGHVHQHVVPRWGADTNFMPVIGSTRVLPESLADSWKALNAAFNSAP